MWTHLDTPLPKRTVSPSSETPGVRCFSAVFAKAKLINVHKKTALTARLSSKLRQMKRCRAYIAWTVWHDCRVAIAAKSVGSPNFGPLDSKPTPSKDTQPSRTHTHHIEPGLNTPAHNKAKPCIHHHHPYRCSNTIDYLVRNRRNNQAWYKLCYNK